MLGHKKDTKNAHYLGMKHDSNSRYTIGNKDVLKSLVLGSSNSHDSSNGIYNNSNSKDAQNEPLKSRFN